MHSAAAPLYSAAMPSIRILCLGDIVGRPGRQVVNQKLPGLVRQHNVDLVVANGENIAGGSGITQNLFNKLRSYGVDIVTLGDHVYKKLDIVPTLQASERIVRPANLSANAAGRAFTVVTTVNCRPAAFADRFAGRTMRSLAWRVVTMSSFL